MKQIQVEGRIITFREIDSNVDLVHGATDEELVRNLLENPNVSEELRALSRLVLFLVTNNQDKTNGSGTHSTSNRRT